MEHVLGIANHLVVLVGATPVNIVSLLFCFSVERWILVQGVRESLTHACRLSMVVSRDSFSKGVSHFKFSVSNVVHEGLGFVEGTISHSV